MEIMEWRITENGMEWKKGQQWKEWMDGGNVTVIDSV